MMTLDEKLRAHQSDYKNEDLNQTLNGNLSNSYWEKNAKNVKLTMRFRKVGFIVWGPWKSVQNFTAIHSVVGDIQYFSLHQRGGTTDQQTNIATPL